MPLQGFPNISEIKYITSTPYFCTSKDQGRLLVVDPLGGASVVYMQLASDAGNGAHVAVQMAYGSSGSLTIQPALSSGDTFNDGTTSSSIVSNQVVYCDCDGATVWNLSGAPGIQGVRGITGLQGATGLQGGNGSGGSQGTTGVQGVTGLGVTGIQGFTGLWGVTGLAAAAGPTIITSFVAAGGVSSSTSSSSQSVAGMSLALAASTTYRFRVVAFLSANGNGANAGLRATSSLTATTLGWMIWGASYNGGSPAFGNIYDQQTSFLAGTMASGTSASYVRVEIEGVITTNHAGNLDLDVHPTTNGSSVSVGFGSYMEAVKL